MVTGKSRMWQRAGGGGVSGQKQKTHGMTKQTQEANDIINKHKKHMATRVLWPAEGILTLRGLNLHLWAPGSLLPFFPANGYAWLSQSTKHSLDSRFYTSGSYFCFLLLLYMTIQLFTILARNLLILG